MKAELFADRLQQALAALSGAVLIRVEVIHPGIALQALHDLPGEQLKNVIVVSTGLPQPDARVKAMQAYYDGIGEDGFDLCMTLPGMIRVIQAAGRLIRTDADTGALLLIDSRYRAPRTRALLSGTLIGDALGIS